ncbi:hypothetical protein ACONUD_16300 [Microbulbifer harenosus]|uniref:Concanavalin A-like lectin/glucanases superfamily protein n=1 Tax=Microbulbifer harenosus TaxID=2576840 RepID=A0ABY2UEG4_9GAMM|nr:hypothetical protein [Microbulbifer harenosus]TLM75636.1 hypothetical protein FDY93_15165 [Microbulbifer harenosus]
MKFGFLIDSAVGGIGYRTESVGQDSLVTTGDDGLFLYREGESVTFYIGDLKFPTVRARPTITPIDLAGGNLPVGDQVVINMTRLLLSLDKDGNPSNGISIDNMALQAGYALDFSTDSTTFESDSATLVANSGSGTTSLVPESDAVSHLQASLDSSVNRRALVSADGADTDNAFELFAAAFGGNPVEEQECAGGHNEFGRHITEVDDELLNAPVFQFNIHLSDDIDCSTGKSDRQRLEVKTYSQSPPELLSSEGEWHSFRWKFRLPDQFQPSTRFTHIFQLKPVGGDDSNPIVSIIPRKSSTNRLQVVHVSGSEEGSVNNVLVEKDLSLFNNKWIDAFVRIRSVDTSGYFEIILRDYLTQETLLSYINNNIDMFRTGASFNRPKWGIYRNILESADLRDESLRFNDFCIAEGTNTCPLDAESSSTAAPRYDFESDLLGAAPADPFTSVEAVVSSEQAKSGSQAVKLSDTSTTDNGKLRVTAPAAAASGSFRVSVWVPNNMDTTAYLTLFSGGNSSASNKVAEAILTSAGDLRLRGADGSQNSVGSYSVEQWNDFEFAWEDIGTSGSYSLYLNGVLVGSGYESVLGGLIPDRVEIKYGTSSSTSGTSIFVDDISAFARCFSCESENGGDTDETAQFDFDAEQLGTAPSEPFTSVEAVISAEQAQSGSQSVKISDTLTSDAGKLRLSADSALNTGSFKASIWMPEDADSTLYLTVFSGGNSASANKIAETILTASGRLYRRAADGSQAEVGSYVPGQWNDVEMRWVDIDSSNSYALYLNGNPIGTAYEVVIGGLVPDRVEIKYGTVSGTSATSAYVDDLSVYDSLDE